MDQVTQFRLDVCEACAAKLRAVLAAQGEKAMARAIAGVLCPACLSKIPGYQPGQWLVSTFKGRPS